MTTPSVAATANAAPAASQGISLAARDTRAIAALGAVAALLSWLPPSSISIRATPMWGNRRFTSF
jgi:hypothetical protein